MPHSTSIAAPRGTSPSVSSLTLLQQAFPGRVQIKTVDLAAALSVTPASVRTMRARGSLAIKTVGCGTYDIRDVAAYLDSLRTEKPRHGAPTKASRIAAAAAQEAGGAK